MERRERQRTAMEQEIKAAARRLMAMQGTGGVSLRLIARELGMSAPSLYHYFASYDALITALILDAFHALADALAEASAAEAQPAARVAAVATAFRAWALDHPIDFLLIYGTPLPNYHAPREQTVPAVIRSYVVLATALDAAWPADAAVSVPASVAAYLDEMRTQNKYPTSVAVLYAANALWTRMYGLVMLELLGHTGPAVGDSAAFYEAELATSLRQFGIHPPA